MITKIQTEESDRWAVVFDECYSLGDIAKCASGLIDLMICATSSELFGSAQNDYYSALSILKMMLPTDDQAVDYEEYIEQKSKAV